LIEEVDAKGRTALFRAARVGRLGNLKLLLERGANANAKDYIDEAPLGVAARYGHAECVSMLLEAGADIDAWHDPKKNAVGESALCSAVRKRFADVVNVLLAAGANPNAFPPNGLVPLQQAAECGDREMCQLLVQSGAAINENGGFLGDTALHRTVSSKRIETQRILLELGADVNMRARSGETPLMRAVVTDNVEGIFELLKWKPDLHAVDAEGYTALDLAKECGRGEIAEILEQTGASMQQDHSTESTFMMDGIPVTIVMGGREENSEVEERDEELTKKLPLRPSNVRQYGWRASAAHWALLQGAGWGNERQKHTPICIVRLAYYARGHRNRPEGEELDDGLQVLGEPYETAVERFVNEGLLRLANAQETMAAAATVEMLKEWARRIGVKSTGQKRMLIDELLTKAGTSAFEKWLEANKLYAKTAAAAAEMAERGRHVDNAKMRFQSEAINAFAAREFLWGLALVQDYMAITETFRRLNPWQISVARRIMENEMPASIVVGETGEEIVRATVAFVTVTRENDVQWAKYGVVREPLWNGQIVTPEEFRRLICNGAEWWEEMEEEDFTDDE
jgi:ankyrin repeat protein